jgi:hypothetical protein
LLYDGMNPMIGVQDFGISFFGSTNGFRATRASRSNRGTFTAAPLGGR